jgi:predicted ester cyclase
MAQLDNQADSLTNKMTLVRQLMIAKRNHDIDGLLAIYTPDCVLEQPSLGVRSIGHAAIRPGLELFARHFPDYRRSFDGVGEDGDTLCSWGNARFTLAGSLNGHVPNGREVEIMTFVLFRFSGNRISYEGHFWDLASICRQSGIPVEAFGPG